MDAGVAPVSESFVITPVDSPRSSAYSRIVFSGSPSTFFRTAVLDCPITPLFVRSPVTMAVMPAAESVTRLEALEVSDSAMCGIR